ncbi:hypothetical protein ACQY0O_008034 [Thecaphora frezii]
MATSQQAPSREPMQRSPSSGSTERSPLLQSSSATGSAVPLPNPSPLYTQGHRSTALQVPSASSSLSRPTSTGAGLDDLEAQPSTASATVAAASEPSGSKPCAPAASSPSDGGGTTSGRLRRFVARNEGFCLLALSQLFFSTMNLFFKLLNSLLPSDSPPISALEIIFVRMSITWVGCVGFMVASGVPEPILGPKGVRGLLALRGISGFFGLFGLYYSLQFLSLADATVITFLSPLATGALGWIVLRERFTLREFLGGLVSLMGVVMIARPAFLFGRKLADEDLDVPSSGDAMTLVLRVLQAHGGGGEGGEGVTEAQRLAAVALALLGVCGGAGAYITIRAIGRRATATHSVAYFSLYSTIVSALLMWQTGTQFVLPQSAKWGMLLVCIGVFGLLAQILLAMGLQREKAGRAVSATYLQIVFASFYQLFILHVPINFLSAVGMGIILSAAAWIAMGKE